MKINYFLDKENYVKGYVVTPFNENEPFIEIENLEEITINKTRIINGALDNTSNGNNVYLKLLERQKIHSLRNKRETLLEAFDKWEKAVLRGREEDDAEIMAWYNDLLELKEKAFNQIPARVKYYL